MTRHWPLSEDCLVRRCGSYGAMLFPAVAVLASVVTLFYAAASSKEVVGGTVYGGEVMLHTRDGFSREGGIRAREPDKNQKDRDKQQAASK